MRIVRRPDDAVGADQRRLRGEREHRLVGVEADPALPLHVLRRQHREVFGTSHWNLLAVVVEPLEPRHEPAAVGLEEDELGVGEPLAHAARGEVRDRAHHVDRVGDRLGEQHEAAVERAAVAAPRRHRVAADRIVLVAARRASRGRLRRSPTHAPGRSGARNGCSAIGRPVSAAACQIGS